MDCISQSSGLFEMIGCLKRWRGGAATGSTGSSCKNCCGCGAGKSGFMGVNRGVEPSCIAEHAATAKQHGGKLDK